MYSPNLKDYFIMSSEIWQHFTKGKKINKCKHCPDELTADKSGSTGNLWRHLDNRHKEIYNGTNYAKTKKRPAEEEKGETSTTTTKKPKTTLTVSQMLQPGFNKTDELANDLADLIIVHNLPFTLKHLDTFKINFTQTLKKGLEDRTCDLLKLQEVEMAAFLDPRYCYKPFVYSPERWSLIKEKVILCLQECLPEEEVEEVEIQNEDVPNIVPNDPGLWPIDEMESTENNIEPNQQKQQVREEVERYIEFATKTDRIKFPNPDGENNNQTAVFFWWKRNAERFPHSAAKMRELLSIKISSVASERCFSKASILFRNTLRNRLSKDLAASMISIQANLADKILKDAAGKYESEEEDDDIDDFMQYDDDF